MPTNEVRSLDKDTGMCHAIETESALSVSVASLGAKLT